MKKPTFRRTGKPTSPEEPPGPQTVHFTIGPPETSLDTPPPVAAPPVPKPRTLPPGKGAEGRPSPGTAPEDGLAGALPLPGPPPPQVPPRRKKSAPAAFHLQVLQSHGLLLQDLAPLPPPAVAQPGPQAASLPGGGQDPLWSLLQPPALASGAWLSESPEPPDTGPRLLRRAHTAPLQVSGPAPEERPPAHGHPAPGPWAAASDTDRRTVLQAFDPLADP